MDIWIPIMSFAMGLFAFGLAELIRKWYAGRRVPEKMHQWHQEIEHAAFDLVRSYINVALHEQRVADLIGKLPDDFDAPCFVAARLGVAVERAVLTESERRGFYPVGTFKDYFGTPQREDVPKPVVEPLPEDAPEPAKAEMPSVWMGDRLVPPPPESDTEQDD